MISLLSFRLWSNNRLPVFFVSFFCFSLFFIFFYFLSKAFDSVYGDLTIMMTMDNDDRRCQMYGLEKLTTILFLMQRKYVCTFHIESVRRLRVCVSWHIDSLITIIDRYATNFVFAIANIFSCFEAGNKCIRNACIVFVHQTIHFQLHRSFICARICRLHAFKFKIKVTGKNIQVVLSNWDASQ